MKVKNLRNKITMLGVSGLILVSAVGGTLAFLTDTEEVTNVFTAGDVAGELLEPNYPGNDSEEVQDTVPNEEIAKDPKVIDTSISDAIVFMTLDSPMSKITVIKDDGSVDTPLSTNELYWFKDKADVASKHENNFDEGWEELVEKEMYILIDENNVETYVESSADALDAAQAQTVGTNKRLVKRYVFAYKQPIQGNSTKDGTAQTEENKQTTELFDKVQLKNVVENEVDNTVQHIGIRAYLIQASSVLVDSVDISKNLSHENLAKIYDVFVRQNSKDSDVTGLKVEGLRDADSIEATDDGAKGSKTEHVNRWNTSDDVTSEGKNVKP